MAERRGGSWVVWILAPIGLLLVFLPGLWVFMEVTATRLHPVAADAPSVARAAPAAKWATAVEQARQVVRGALGEGNLPGLSVAVGVSRELVWAEGFGFADLDRRVPVAPNHKFRIGTASAVLTSAAVGRL